MHSSSFWGYEDVAAKELGYFVYIDIFQGTFKRSTIYEKQKSADLQGDVMFQILVLFDNYILRENALSHVFFSSRPVLANKY